MSGRYVAIIDSGIGGISVLEECLKVLPNENFIYLGDNGNAPYGNRTDSDLVNITVENIERIKEFNLKAVVFGCNTISARVLHTIEYIYPEIPFFGTFPPVEINLLHRRKTLLLCTPNTAKSYTSDDSLTVIPLSNLAKDIEDNVFDIDRVDLTKHFSEAINNMYHDLTTKVNCLTTQNMKMIFDHRLGYFDVVILGCTHYNFIKSKIFNHFQPRLITGGETIVAINLKKFLQEHKSLEKNKQKRIIFAGDYKHHNKMVFLLRNDYFAKNHKNF